MSAETERLEARRGELEKRLRAIRKDVGSGMDKDYEEQSIQLENLEVLEEIARVAEEEIRQIDIRLAELRARKED
ncbi:MAG: hypothetical protein R3348_05440 [Xanthomonadales bacterium]|nr:hypothetical protein [Xanthomonadales bacterium]